MPDRTSHQNAPLSGVVRTGDKIGDVDGNGSKVVVVNSSISSDNFACCGSPPSPVFAQKIYI